MAAIIIPQRGMMDLFETIGSMMDGRRGVANSRRQR
jgi:hypothetical protein